MTKATPKISGTVGSATEAAIAGIAGMVNIGRAHPIMAFVSYFILCV